MMLMSLVDVLDAAAHRRSGVGAFNIIQIEHAEALVGAAENSGLPVVLQISENTAAYHGGLAPITLATAAIAQASSAQCVLHLDHAERESLVDEAIDLGFTSVMFDRSKLDDATNRSTTRAVVERCHACGVSVEAELGEIGGKDGVHAPGTRTNPVEAAAFVADTGVDALAVAVGSSHAMTSRTAMLDLALIARIHRTVAVPLVLHGSSGVSDDLLVAAMDKGITKVNIATHLNAAFTGAVRAHLTQHPLAVDTRTYLGAARSAIRSEAERMLRLLANTDRLHFKVVLPLRPAIVARARAGAGAVIERRRRRSNLQPGTASRPMGRCAA